VERTARPHASDIVGATRRWAPIGPKGREPLLDLAEIKGLRRQSILPNKTKTTGPHTCSTNRLARAERAALGEGAVGKGGLEGWPRAASRAVIERNARGLKGHPGFLARRARKCPTNHEDQIDLRTVYRSRPVDHRPLLRSRSEHHCSAGPCVVATRLRHDVKPA
jgi:hypothetical protein